MLNQDTINKLAAFANETMNSMDNKKGRKFTTESLTAFAKAMVGPSGSMTTWLKNHKEDEVRANIIALVATLISD